MKPKALLDVLNLAWKAVVPLGQVWRAAGGNDGALDSAIARVRTNRMFRNSGGFYAQGFGRSNLLPRFAVELGGQPSSHAAVAATPLVQKEVPRIDVRPRRVEQLELLASPDAWIGEGIFPTVSDTTLLPPESWRAAFQLVVPRVWDAGVSVPPALADVVAARPVIVLLPGTGEHGFGRRRTCVALSLAKAGVATLILEGPLYGERKAASQSASKLHTLMDLCILGRATIEEARALLRWASELTKGELESFRAGGHNKTAAGAAAAGAADSGEPAFGPLVVGGTSMGGLHAAMTAAMTPAGAGTGFNQRLGVVSWLGPPSAAPVFTLGELARAVDWEALDASSATTRPHVEAMEAILATLRADADAAGYAGDGMAKSAEAATDFSPYPPFQHAHDQDVVTAHEHLLAAAPGQVAATAATAAAPSPPEDDEAAANARVLELWGGAAITLGRRRSGARATSGSSTTTNSNSNNISGSSGAWETLPFPHTPLPPAVYQQPKAEGGAGGSAASSLGFPLPIEVTIPLPRLPLPWRLPTSLTFRTAAVAAGKDKAVAAASVATVTTATPATAAAAPPSAAAARRALWDEASKWSAGTLASRVLMARFLRITDLTNMPAPARPDAAVFVVANDDRYVPWTRSVVSQWLTVRDKLWRGATLRVIRGGHVSGSLFEADAYSKTVVEVVRRLLAPRPPQA